MNSSASCSQMCPSQQQAPFPSFSIHTRLQKCPGRAGTEVLMIHLSYEVLGSLGGAGYKSISRDEGRGWRCKDPPRCIAIDLDLPASHGSDLYWLWIPTCKSENKGQPSLALLQALASSWLWRSSFSIPRHCLFSHLSVVHCHTDNRDSHQPRPRCNTTSLSGALCRR